MDYTLKTAGNKMLQAVLDYRETMASVIADQTRDIVNNAAPGATVERVTKSVTDAAHNREDAAKSTALKEIEKAANEAAEHYTKGMGDLPTPEQAALLQVLSLRGSGLTETEYRAFAKELEGNYIAATTLDDIAVKSGIAISATNPRTAALRNIEYARAFCSACIPYQYDDADKGPSIESLGYSVTMRLEGKNVLGGTLTGE